MNGDQDKFDLVWPSVFSLAVIRRKKFRSKLEIDGKVEEEEGEEGEEEENKRKNKRKKNKRA